MPKEPVDISIIMLTYFHERYIIKAIESILSQRTGLRYEILIGDDASGDRTPEIILDYARRYPHIIRPVLRKENLGANLNFYGLLHAAKGSYIAILEGDDYWCDPYKLQKQWQFLEKNTAYIGCCSKCLIVDQNDQPDYTRSPQFVWNKKEFTFNDYLTTWELPGQLGSLMYRNIFRQMQPEDYSIIYTAHRNAGDKTLMLLLLPRGPIYCSNEILSCYRYVTQKDGHNYFSMHYNNPNRHYDMFMYPCRLEAWAKKNLGVRCHLGPRREYRFCRFVEQCVKEPSLKRFGYLLDMIVHSRQPVRYSWDVLKTLIEME